MLVLCCGNTDRGDDAAGLLVARRLREMGIGAREHDGDALALIEAWREAGEVILVDAVVTGKPPGSLSVWNALETFPGGRPSLRSSHAMGLAEAVALARTLGWLPRRLTLFGIEARRFDFGAPPSRRVLRGVEQAARKIREYYAGPDLYGPNSRNR
jgi:hydrogenase maturation protease